MIRNYATDESAINNELRSMIHKYSSKTRAYEAYCTTWKTAKTWETYWKEMNKLEDIIDGLIRIAIDVYNVTIAKRCLEIYEIAQERRARATEFCKL